MRNNLLKNLLPIGAAIIVFLALSLAYFSPVVDGKRLAQQDIQQFKGSSQEIVEHRDATGEEPLWVGSMFSGMPAYQISVLFKGNVLKYVDKAFRLWLPAPASFLFLYLAGMYMLLLCLRVDKWTALVGALAFAFSSYFFVIIDAGHNSKAAAIGWMPPVLGAFVLLYRGKEMLGAALLALFMALEVLQNHVQVTYYLGLALALFAFAEAVKAVREKTIVPFIRRSALALVAVVLAVLCNAGLLWSTYEYGKYTTRGKTELTITPDGSSAVANQTTGLDRDYVPQWSYGKQESFTLLIPNAKGGASGSIINDRKDFDAIKDQDFKRIVGEKYQSSYINSYWGDQMVTSGPVYLGAIVVLLMLLALSQAEALGRWWALAGLAVMVALIYVTSPMVAGLLLVAYLLAGAFLWKDTLGYALFAALVLTLTLSWGKNLMPLTDFFLDHLPGYNKFRAVTIILVIVELAAPVLGILYLDRLLKQGTWDKLAQRRFLITAGSLALVVAVMAITPDTFFSFFSDNEAAQLEAEAAAGAAEANKAQDYIDGLKSWRTGVFSADAWRSFGFIVAGAALLWFFGKGKANKAVVLGGLGVLLLLDQWTIDRRYVNSDAKKENGKPQWEEPVDNAMPYEATGADLAILQAESTNNPAFNAEFEAVMARLKEKKSGLSGRMKMMTKEDETLARFSALRRSTHYRVANLGNPFNDASTSWLHKSIGGYHGAKLKRYQEMIEFHLSPEIRDFGAGIRGATSMQEVNDVLAQQPALNMLNTRYLIIDPTKAPIRNLHALGAAWFVEQVKWVKNSDEEIQAINGLQPDSVVVVDERYRADLPQPAVSDPSATVELKQYASDRMEYTCRSASGGVIVFSEIWYGPDWVATIDGQPAPYVRANYILRAMNVPAGEHSIVFQVQSRTFTAGGTISLIGSLLVMLIAAGALYMDWKKSSTSGSLTEAA
ncbi:MAG: hypothetical protein IPI55_19550 [Flavobacteriales bacterium]|nr:hypothetical protein [Flavobacteriales bacterium]